MPTLPLTCYDANGDLPSTAFLEPVASSSALNRRGETS